jgi:hypothetical protein
MCDKCAELDSKIEHYEHLASRIADQPTLDGDQRIDRAGEGKKGRASSRANRVRPSQLAACFIWRRGLVALLNPPAINILDQYTIASAAGRAALL